VGEPYFNPNHSVAMPRKGEETDHVGDRRDEGSGRNRGIGPRPLQQHGNEDPAERTSNQIADDRKSDHDAKPGDMETRRPRRRR